MVEAEKPGQNIEKLLMERVMLRKELRLRRVSQEASAGGAGLIKRGVVNSCMGLYRLIL